MADRRVSKGNGAPRARAAGRRANALPPYAEPADLALQPAPPPARKKRGRWRRVLGLTLKALAPILVLVLGVASYAGLKATRPEVPQRPVRAQIWPVKAVPTTFADYQPSIRLYGHAMAGRKVELRALVAGEVVEVGAALREGGMVAKDDVLLRIDAFAYQGALDEAEAKLAEARAKLREIEAALASEQDALRRGKEQLAIARRDLERAVPLAERGTVSQKLADDRRMVVSEREQAMELRENNLTVHHARAEQQNAIIAQLSWKVRQARRNLDDTVLKAPYDAYVTGASAEVGRIVNANDQVATLLDRDWIEIRFALTNAQYGRIVAQHGEVTGRLVDALWHIGDEPVRYRAKIERVAAQISAESGGVDVFAKVVDPREPVPLRPGAFVEVRVQDRVYSNVARLPQTALYGGDTVYVIAGDKLAARKVVLIGAARTDVLVRGELKPGERVMTTRLSKAEAGLRVQEQ